MVAIATKFEIDTHYGYTKKRLCGSTLGNEKVRNCLLLKTKNIKKHFLCLLFKSGTQRVAFAARFALDDVK